MFNIQYGDLVTVIVPAFNHDKYIVKALDSVYRQTYPNIELIFIDDHSKDGSLLSATEWAGNVDIKKRFSRLRLLKNEVNIGAHASINRGIAEAKGSVVFILNSDDIFAHARIEHLVNAMSQSGSGFAFSKVMPIDDSETKIAETDLPALLSESFHFADAVALKYPSLGFGFLEKNLAISTGNLAIHRELFEKIGNFRSLQYVHDWDFALRAILETEPVYVAEPLYGYRIHGTNSFSQLAHVKDIELDAMAAHFCELVKLGKFSSPLAPTPANWPYVFEIFVSSLYLLRWNDFARDVATGLESRLKFAILPQAAAERMEYRL
ncbi:MAG: glycosyltransferase [Candidatus Nitrotoga sp.]